MRAPRRTAIVVRAAALIAAGALGAALAAGGCAQPQRGPADTLASFGAAVEKKDYPAAYALMSPAYRKGVSLADFRAAIDRGGADLGAIARRLRQGAPGRPMRIDVDVGDEADVAAGLGDKVTLVLDHDQWRVDAPPFDVYSQATPRAALRTFLRAVGRGRYDVAVRLVPNRYRAGVTPEKLRAYWEGERKEENQKLLQRLRAAIRSPIIEVGDEARMPYGDNSAEVVFVREDGVWKIEDPD
jgi:hypothetical protein